MGWGKWSRSGFVYLHGKEDTLGPLGKISSILLRSIWRVHGDEILRERVKCIVGNEIELGIGYRRPNLGQGKYRKMKGWDSTFTVHRQYEDIPGVIARIQTHFNNHWPRVSRSCPERSRTDRETHLRCRWWFGYSSDLSEWLENLYRDIGKCSGGVRRSLNRSERSYGSAGN